MAREYVDEDREITESDLSGPEIDRRTTVKLLGLTGTLGLAGLAGCAGGGGGDDGDGGGDGGDGGDGGGDGGSDGSGGDGGSDGSDGDGDGGDTSDRRGGTLDAGWNVSQFDKIDPHFSISTFKIQLIGNFFSGLVELAPDFTVQPDLASDWEVTNGGERITFDLVENATFHNGDEFTAEDVKFSINRVLTTDNPHKSKFSALQPIDDGGVNVVDDYTVEMNFSEAVAPIFVYLTPDAGLAGAVVSQGALEEMGREQFKITPVGTGPFRIDSHELGSTMELVRHEGYHKTDGSGTQLPYLDGINLEPISEHSTRINALQAGDLQFTNWVQSSQAAKVKGAQGLTLHQMMGPNFGGLAFNNTEEPFTSRKVRRAIAKAIDRERYVKEAFLGRGQPDTGVYSPAHEWVYREEFGDAPDQKPPDQQYAPEEARQMLREEGVTDVEFTLPMGPPNARKTRVMRNILQDELGELGWTLKTEMFDIPTIFERLGQGNFELIIFGNSVIPDPGNIVWGSFGPPEQSSNWWGYTGAVDLLRQQRTQLDRETRKQTLWEIEDKLIRDAPWAFCEHEEMLSGHDQTVQGYEHIGVVMRLRDVWLEG